MTTCITPFDQWDTFNDVTHQNIPQNRTGVVAEILCIAGSLGGEWSDSRSDWASESAGAKQLGDSRI